MEVNTEHVLPKGTVVKLGGMPLELLADTPVRGERIEAAGAQQTAPPPEIVKVTRSSSGCEAR